jgi:hypothetical protein
MIEAYPIIAADTIPNLRDAWISLVNRWQWEWFATFTFRDMVHPESADKRFRLLNLTNPSDTQL